MATAQYRVAFGKKDEAVEGPDDADVVVSIAAADVGIEPAVAFMRGKLKSSGSTDALVELLKSDELSATLRRLGTR